MGWGGASILDLYADVWVRLFILVADPTDMVVEALPVVLLAFNFPSHIKTLLV